MKIKNAVAAGVLACGVYFSPAAHSEILFSNPVADGSIPNPSIFVNYNLNGNCWFSCVGPGSTLGSFGSFAPGYMADDFSLASAATISSIQFVGIRTSQDLNVTGNVTWGIFSDTGVFDNSGNGTKSMLGSLVASGTSALSRQGTLFNNQGQDFSNYSFSLPGVDLSGGSYFLALHADIDGWSGDADNTTLYMAYGYGDGRWAWRWENNSSGTASSFPSDSEASWTNPNSQLTLGGLAFSVSGNSIAPVPEPETYAMLLAGLGLLGLMARRRKQQG